VKGPKEVLHQLALGGAAIALSAGMMAVVPAASPVAAASRPSNPSPTARLGDGSQHCSTVWAIFQGKDWLQSTFDVQIEMHGCWTGTTSYAVATRLSTGDIAAISSYWFYLGSNTGEAYGYVDSRHQGTSGSAPAHYWANVYAVTDWRGVQQWYYPRVELSATGHWSCRDGGGSYWSLSCSFE
jgi:hypothetical protein